jgi:large subunit ribosomal protein L27
MSKTKQGGSSRLGRDSAAQRLGIKAYAGEKVKIGMIIVRQRGTKYLLGKNVKMGSDDTIYAMKDGVVSFSTKIKTLYDGSRRTAKVVSVNPTEAKVKAEVKVKAKAK